MKLANSPITQHRFNQTTFYLKRDDQLHSQFSGNKARKFMALLDYNDPNITTLIGYGSVQANSLYSLAALAKIKGWQFTFYVQSIPTWLKDRPSGNYRGALELDTNIVELADISTLHPQQYIEQHHTHDPHCLCIPEGGRDPIAQSGIKQLAQEIIDWVRLQDQHKFVVALPAGTGTTALYLHKNLKIHNIEVLTCACVGGDEYLTLQFNQLNETCHPTILSLNEITKKKHHFGSLYKQDYITWLNLQKQTNVEFDLLYDPLMWRCLEPWLENNPDKTLLYIHQGGLLGNESMLPRYQRKYPEI